MSVILNNKQNIRMDKKSLTKILHLLQKSKNVKKKDRKQYFMYCSDDEIHAICGGCKNFLSENIEVEPKKKTYLKRKLLPIKNEMRILSNKDTPLPKKRKLLAKTQVGSGIFSLLAGVIIPTIVSALAGK